MSAEEIFGLVFMTIFGYCTIAATYYLIKAKNFTDRRKQFFTLVIGVLFTGIGYHLFIIEHSIRTESVYVEGTTIDYCRTGKYGNGRGIEFAYYIDGNRFVSCNGDAEGVKVPGGKYMVKVSKKYPDLGRIDYSKPVIKR